MIPSTLYAQIKENMRQSCFLALGLLMAVLMPLVFPQPFPRHVMIMILLYATLGQAWNIIGGLAGQISLGHTIYFGLGAYTSTLAFIHFELTPWVGMLLGALVASLTAILIGYPFFRLKGFYYAIATMALGETARIIFLNLRIIGGAVGLELPLVTEQLLLYMQFHRSKAPYYYIILLIFLTTMFLFAKIKRSRMGLYFNSIKESHEAAESLGIDTFKYKLKAIAISAFITSICGSFYAQYLLYIDPYVVLDFGLSTKICLVTILGGEGSLSGPFVGSCLLVLLSEYSRVFLGGGGRGVDLIVYGTLIVLVAAYQPRGLVGWFEERQQKKTSEVGRHASA